MKMAQEQGRTCSMHTGCLQPHEDRPGPYLSASRCSEANAWSVGRQGCLAQAPSDAAPLPLASCAITACTVLKVMSAVCSTANLLHCHVKLFDHSNTAIVPIIWQVTGRHCQATFNEKTSDARQFHSLQSQSTSYCVYKPT